MSTQEGKQWFADLLQSDRNVVNGAALAGRISRLIVRKQPTQSTSSSLTCREIMALHSSFQHPNTSCRANPAPAVAFLSPLLSVGILLIVSLFAVAIYSLLVISKKPNNTKKKEEEIIMTTKTIPAEDSQEVISLSANLNIANNLKFDEIESKLWDGNGSTPMYFHDDEEESEMNSMDGIVLSESAPIKKRGRPRKVHSESVGKSTPMLSKQNGIKSYQLRSAAKKQKSP